MAKPIPKWVQERVSRLWNKFEGKEINYDEIKETLSMDDSNTISVFLNELKKAEWIEIKLSKEDMRKRVYILKEPNQVMKEIIINEN
jgi:hypothetical protein